VAVAAVEPQCDIPCQLHMLRLVSADRYVVDIVLQDVRGHQDRVRQQRQTYVCLTRALLLELDPPLGLAGRGRAFGQIVQLWRGRDVRLDVERRAIGVEAGREQQRRIFQRGRVYLGRLVFERERMQVGDEDE